jgi:uncharacterized membrane protein (UPF0127 family)
MALAAEIHGTDGQRALLCERCVIADGPLTRLRGLLGRPSLPDGEGLLLRPSGSIHTWFMRFAIDVVFLDEDGTVLRLRADLGPWRMVMQRGARAVLELPAGTLARHGGVGLGDRLELRSPDGES